MYDAQYLKISKLFEEVEENKKSIVTGSIEQACFMYVQLKELNEIINKKNINNILKLDFITRKITLL